MLKRRSVTPSSPGKLAEEDARRSDGASESDDFESRLFTFALASAFVARMHL